jgi:PhnB protein
MNTSPTQDEQTITIEPMLSVRNGVRAIEFYKTAFGAEVLFRLDGEAGAVVAELSIGGSRFWLADESPEHFNFSPESLGGGSVRMIMVVNHPDAVFERAIEAGATAVWPVADQPYGWRVGRLVDPFGHHWEIGKPSPNSS